MYKNMLIHKQDFILCVMFPAGDYQDITVLYNKFKDYPYIWHTIVETGSFFSNTDLLSHNSQLTLNKTINLTANRIVHIRCILTPKKDIDMDNKHFIKIDPMIKGPIILKNKKQNNPTLSTAGVEYTSGPDQTQDITEVVRVARSVRESSAKPGYEHPEITIPKIGSAVFKAPPRYGVTKKDLDNY